MAVKFVTYDAESTHPGEFVTYDAEVTNPGRFVTYDAEATHPGKLVMYDAEVTHPGEFVTYDAESTNPRKWDKPTGTSDVREAPWHTTRIIRTSQPGLDDEVRVVQVRQMPAPASETPLGFGLSADSCV